MAKATRAMKASERKFFVSYRDWNQRPSFNLFLQFAAFFNMFKLQQKGIYNSVMFILAAKFFVHYLGLRIDLNSYDTLQQSSYYSNDNDTSGEKYFGINWKKNFLKFNIFEKQNLQTNWALNHPEPP